MKLENFLQGIKPMPDNKASFIASHFKKEIHQKGISLLKEGQISKKSYFVESGIVRCFIIDLDGNEITTRFYSTPDFLNDYLSFFSQKPANENYELLTDCVLYSITLDNVQKCFHNVPEFREWGRMLLTLNYSYMSNKMIDYHKLSAQERYLKLMNEQPEIVQQAPLNMIASYLNVTKYSLSRIRKELTKS
ncbi:Crp/Fnr family transcriptional regulator [Aureibacter tunicatorum]|uniref:CRP-like cAMP-binding protein n=1 Tax=Aureibacter tunicatorum TaxID=866807 RepID=A0AAE3XNP8_9BACT|nr:Crp/Fnr family transcriptional regulator [Aureibacter tunicatorum]MDR6239249.1 CRP-like cAMP-binding protein [Aureibacter tunicatorum]BDD04826.1 cAMP-binding protein [Aureibacter tunicatorum]